MAESRLNNTESQINNLFLIGAGFTRAVFPDAPLNKDLFHAIVSANPKSKLSLYSKKYGTEDIEILLTRLDSDIAETESNVLEQERMSIEMDLCEYFSRFRFAHSKLEQNPWLEKFAREVLRENDALVTTNYDCFLEGLLDFYGIWSPKRGYVNVENDLLSSPDNPKNILIYKIHGSENFRIAPFANDKNKKLIAFDVEENDQIFSRSAEYKHLGFARGLGPSPYIIAPSFIKFPHVQIADMINKATTQAALAQNLVIGGSGLRREDNFLWLFLTSFLNKVLKVKKKLTIADPGADRIRKELDRYWIGGTRHYTAQSITSGFGGKGIDELQEALQGY
jgi:hypothetical protein